MRSTRILAATLLAGGLFCTPARAVNPQADVVVYGAQLPQKFKTGEVFQSPYMAVEDTDDPPTRIVFEQVAGMRNVLGGEQWGLTTFGKYVFTGNYGSVPGASVIGVIDSEHKTFFEINIPNDAARVASKRTLQVANPTARQSRIFLAGNGTYQGSAAGLAYIEADLDTDPSTWPVTVLTEAQLGTGLGDFDGVSVLRHEEDSTAFGRDFIVLNGWIGAKIGVARIDSAGGATIASYATPRMVLPTGAGGASCSYVLRPVQLPTVDFSRPRNDQRIVTAYDASPPDGCPFTIKVAQEFRIDLDSATPTLTPTSPLFQGTTVASPPPAHLGGSNAMLSSRLDSIGNLWVSYWPPAGQGPAKPWLYYKKAACPNCCVVNGQTVPSVAGEHCYYLPNAPADQVYAIGLDQKIDFEYSGGSNLGTAHGIVQFGDSMYLMSQSSVQRAGLAYGSWFLAGDTSYKMALHSPILPAEPRECRDYKSIAFFSIVNTHYPCNCPPGTPADATCSAAPECVDQTGTQRDCSPVLWSCRQTADPTVGTNGGCVCPSDSDTSCSHPRCAAGESCFRFGENAAGSQWNFIVAAGGSTPSLWVAERYRGGLGTLEPKQNLFLFRIPLTSAIPDATSTTRPGAVWSDDRLWLVSEHSGSLAYRIRTKGQWSDSWSPLPANVALSGGAAVIASSVYVPHLEAFARGASGGIYGSLLSSTNCTQGTCAWGSWQLLPIPGTITPAGDPAAAYLDFTAPIIVVRNSADNGIYFTRRYLNVWSTWTRIPGLASDSSPAVAWNPSDGSGTWWVAARESGTGRILSARVIPNGSASTTSAWTEVGSGGSLAPWLSPPAIAYDGSVMRVFTSATPFPNYLYEAVHDGTAWGSWKGLSSDGVALRQPTTAVVNGDVHLIASWWNSLAEMLAK